MLTLTFVFPNTHDGIRYRVIESDNVRFVNLQGQFYSAASSMEFEVHDGGAVSAPAGRVVSHARFMKARARC